LKKSIYFNYSEYGFFQKKSYCCFSPEENFENLIKVTISRDNASYFNFISQERSGMVKIGVAKKLFSAYHITKGQR
jgi:intergrase/recombinase